MDLYLIRKAIASEKARLVASIMRHNQSALSSIPNQQVSREPTPERVPEEADPPVALVSIGSAPSDQQSSNTNNNSYEDEPFGNDTPAIRTRHMESFPEVSLAISSSETLYFLTVTLSPSSLLLISYSTACWRKWKTLKSLAL
jgi:hypothetical protein